MFESAIGFDLETWGTLAEYALQPHRARNGDAGIRAASWYINGQATGTLNPSCDLLTRVFTVHSDKTFIGWNIQFDIAWSMAVGVPENLLLKITWIDSMLLWRHAWIEPESEKAKKKSYSLANAIAEFCPEYSEDKEFHDFQATDAESLKKLLARNKVDAYVPVLLAEKFWGQLSDNQRRAALIEARCIPLVAKANLDGLAASREKAVALGTKLDHVAQEAMLTIPELVNYDLGSPRQLADLLYGVWGLPVQGRSAKTGAASTDKSALYHLAAIDPRAKTIKEIREARNNKVKFADAIAASLAYNDDGRVRPNARIFGTYTSRMTYSSKQGKGKSERPTGCALHQWKRGSEYRGMIEAPEGFTLCEFDFAGQEFRWMAVASGDETMLSLCVDGQDAHSYMGAQIARVDYNQMVEAVKAGDKQASAHRKVGKFANLSFQYRISARNATIKAKVDYGMDDATEPFIGHILDIYKESYPGVPLYWRDQVAKCRHLGYAETFAGRRVILNGSWQYGAAWALESTAINYPIQGTGGDQKYLALAVARNELAKFGGHFYFELHDGLFFIFPNEKVVQAAHHFHKTLSNLPYRLAWGRDFPIKFPVDGKMGPSWGELKDL